MKSSRKDDDRKGTLNDKGDCYICTETATVTCTRCGGRVCGPHYEKDTELCIRCT